MPHGLRIAMLTVLSAFLLGGCMSTPQERAAFEEAFMSSFAQGLMAGAATNIGQGIALKSKPMIATGAAQMVLGAAAQAGAGAAAQAGASPPGAGNGMNGLAGPAAGMPATASAMAGGGGLPNTPQCAQYDRAARRLGHMYGGTSLQQVLTLYHACLNSAPDHPASRRLRCGPGQYVVYFNNRRYCGTEAALRADAVARMRPSGF